MPTLSVFRAFCQAFHTIKDNPVLVLRLMIPVVVVHLVLRPIIVIVVVEALSLAFTPDIQLIMAWLDWTITAISLWLAGVLSVNIITLAVAGPDALPNPERAAWVPGVLALKVLITQIALLLFAWLAVAGMLIGVSVLASPFIFSNFLSTDWAGMLDGDYAAMFIGGIAIFMGFLMFRARLRLIFAPVTMALGLSAPLDTSRKTAHGIIGKLFLLLCLAGVLEYFPGAFAFWLYLTELMELLPSGSATDSAHQTIEFIKTVIPYIYSLQILVLFMYVFTSAAIACAFRQVRDRDAQATS